MKCTRCMKPTKGKHSLCAYCRSQITKYLSVGCNPRWIADKMGVSHKICRNMSGAYKPKGSLLPPGHSYFDYRGKLGIMLSELSEKTGIKNWKSEKGQEELERINRELADEPYHSQSVDCPDVGEIYGMRHGRERSEI